MVSRSRLLVGGQQDMPGERRRHRKGRRCGCKETVLPVLNAINHSYYALTYHEVLHRLKLVTGVDISTRPVRRLGREGKAKKRTSLRTAAEVKSDAFRLSITMLNDSGYTLLYFMNLMAMLRYHSLNADTDTDTDRTVYRGGNGRKVQAICLVIPPI